MSATRGGSAQPRRHVRKPRRDLPWRLRPRPPLNLREGGTIRVAILAVGLPVALVFDGLRGLTEPWSTARVLLSLAMLVAGSVASTVIVFYVKRPPYT